VTSLDTLGVSALFVALTMVAAVNPVERRVALAHLRPTSWQARACGAAVTFVALAALALAAGPLLDALEVSPATARVAAGLVLLLRALLDVLAPADWSPAADDVALAGPPSQPASAAASAEPHGPTEPHGPNGPVRPAADARTSLRRAAPVLRLGAVPVAFPVLFRPELALLVLAFAGSDRRPACLAALAVGLVLFAVLPAATTSGRRGRALGRSTALIVAALAVGTVVGGVLDL
jgi:small neutral amino acid transporter SnatA (MarC family)